MIEIKKLDKNDNPIKIGDHVRIESQRGSGSYSSWHQKRNINHGFFPIDGIVIFDEKALAVCIDYDEDEIKRIRQPIGRERINQYFYPLRKLEHIPSKNILILTKTD